MEQVIAKLTLLYTTHQKSPNTIQKLEFYINKQLPSKSKILLWSNDGYYLERDYLYVLGFITSMANGKKNYDPKQVLEELKLFGITHVAMTDNYLRKKLKKTLLVTNELRVLYQNEYMTVASLPMTGQ